MAALETLDRQNKTWVPEGISKWCGVGAKLKMFKCFKYLMPVASSFGVVKPIVWVWSVIKVQCLPIVVSTGQKDLITSQKPPWVNIKQNWCLWGQLAVWPTNFQVWLAIEEIQTFHLRIRLSKMEFDAACFSFIIVRLEWAIWKFCTTSCYGPVYLGLYI